MSTDAEHSQGHDSGVGQRVRLSWTRLLVTSAIMAGALVALGFLLAGRMGIEKTVTRLSQPVGVGWILLSAWCVQTTWLNGFASALRGWVAWGCVMILTTSPLATWCIHRLESSVECYRPDRDGALAAVVVLGGGTSQGPFRAEVGGAGDRVLYAAQLFHQGQTKRLITTGDAAAGISRDMTSPREHTIEIWTRLGIPESAIGGLQGRNTFEELQSLKQVADQLPSGKVGLLTSALHLPRAMRLAKSAGVEVVPLAANHQYSESPFVYLDFIPSAGPLIQLAACQHEFMAWFVGR